MAQRTITRPNNPKEAQAYFENKMTFTTGPVETERLLHDENVVIVDVRAEEDFREGHVPGAINIPQDRWDNPQGMSKDKQNILYCYSVVCHLAAKACVQFAGMGYPVMEMDGGFRSWKENELPVER